MGQAPEPLTLYWDAPCPWAAVFTVGACSLTAGAASSVALRADGFSTSVVLLLALCGMLAVGAVALHLRHLVDERSGSAPFIECWTLQPDTGSWIIERGGVSGQATQSAFPARVTVGWWSEQGMWVRTAPMGPEGAILGVRWRWINTEALEGRGRRLRHALLPS